MTDASTSAGPSSPPRRFRVALVGANGYGLTHLRTLRRLAGEGRAELVGVADPRPPEGESRDLVGAAPHHPSLTELLERTEPDVVVVATPIDTHADLASAALRAGSHVMLEKPPTASLAEHTDLLATVERTGLACQVGFQSFGSHALTEIERVVAAGEIGEVTGVGGVGTWLRSTTYYGRSRWAGRRRLDGRDVVDGVVTNPLAHAVATALRVAGARRRDDVAALELDLFRAHDIEADDTSSVRVLLPDRTPVALGLTLAAPRQTPPRVLVHGTEGTITLWYTTDELEVDGRAGRRRATFGRTPLLDNLLDHLTDPAVPLLSPLVESGAFMAVLEAVRSAPDPAAVGAEHVTWVEDAEGRHPVVRDVEQWCERVGRELRTFTSLGAPWAPHHEELATLTVAGTAVATYVDGAGTSRLDSPRPHLHPVRTRGGVTVSDSAPADHTWHAGMGVAVQDVAGHNLWGGRTYLRDRGYQWRADHGRIVHEGWAEQAADRLVEVLTWRGSDDRPLLRETRTIAWTELGDAWQLRFSSTLHAADDDVPLGSPGSNGRPGGGYGGFFWRLPACEDVDVRTPTHRGEDAVHGTRAPWLAWSARTGGATFTVALAPGDTDTARDPWFVRAAGYPGIGSALAWDAPLLVPAGGSITRSVRALVADGRLGDDEVTAALD